jgi:hypothetical protein
MAARSVRTLNTFTSISLVLSMPASCDRRTKAKEAADPGSVSPSGMMRTKSQRRLPCQKHRGGQRTRGVQTRSTGRCFAVQFTNGMFRQRDETRNLLANKSKRARSLKPLGGVVPKGTRRVFAQDSGEARVVTDMSLLGLEEWSRPHFVGSQ